VNAERSCVIRRRACVATVGALVVIASSCGGALVHGRTSAAALPGARVIGHTPAAHARPAAAPRSDTGEAALARDPSAAAIEPASLVTTEPPLGGPTPIEDPSGHALDALHAALHRVQDDQAQARIVFYGASHVASDQFTGALRQLLQHRFGEAGPGFVVPGKPWRWYRNAGITIEQSRGFRASRIVERSPEAGIYGLAGVAMDAGGKGALAAIATRGNGGLSGRVSRFELYYLKQPKGGHLQVFIDGKRVQRLSTAAQSKEPAYADWKAPDGAHHFELRAERDGAVRVFGVALERDQPGVILDTLGVPGSRVRDQLYWDDAVYREHLARRHPDMVVLSYGTNESGDDDVPIDQYEAHLRRVLTRVREVAKDASCLLIGPSDRPLRNDDDGSFADRPLTQAIAQSQRKISAEFGCGFFDLQRFMGGPMSMLRWVGAVPPLGTADYVHFTQAGYERLGAVLNDDLLAGFEASAPPAPEAPPAVAASSAAEPSEQD
jgi:lysophospholipase L1-like esterase